MALLRLDGTKDPIRRRALDSPGGGVQIISAHRGEPYPPMRRFRKTSLTYAVRLDEPFEVETIEGLHTGKAGDWLAVGAAGEMYPIDAAVFAATYEEAGT